jgi:hypothetical protein
MKTLLLISAVLILCVSVIADDDGTRFGCWNTSSIDYEYTTEDWVRGHIMVFAGGSGHTADSCGVYINSTNITRLHKCAVYEWSDSPSWDLVDSTAPVSVTASADTVIWSFIFQENYTLLDDSTYLLIVVAESGGGSSYCYAQDSTGEGGQRNGSFNYETQWPATAPGNTSGSALSGIMYIKYAEAAATGYTAPIIIEE